MGYFKDKQPFRVEFSPPMSVVNVVSNSIIYLYFLGDAPYSSPSAQTPSVPVGVPPGLEYLTQVVLLSLLFSRFHENASMHLITKHGHFLKFQIDQVLIHQKVELLEGEFLFIPVLA